MRALITGAVGQDASYLAELLLKKKYDIYGLARMQDNRDNIKHIEKDIHFIYGDLSNTKQMASIIRETNPDEIYNLGAISHVGYSFNNPLEVTDVNALGVVRILEAVKSLNKNIRIYQASSSEMFGTVKESPQNENTPFNPRSPYACSKAYAFYMMKNYREEYGMHASNGIMYNHECISPKNVIMIKKNGFIKIYYMSDIKKEHGGYAVQTYDFSKKDIKIMTSEGFKKIKTITIRSKNSINDNIMRNIQTRNGLIKVTNEHNCLMQNNEKIKAKDIKKKIILKICNFEENEIKTKVSKEFARFLGYMVADGSIYKTEGYYQCKYIKNDDGLRKDVHNLAQELFMVDTHEGLSRSGFNDNKVKYISFNNVSQECLSYLNSLMYHIDRKKKVPEIILNSSVDIMKEFFDAYYEGDGLKKDKCKYKYKAVKSNSALLIQGLYFISKVALNLTSTFYTFKQNGNEYFCLNFNKQNSKIGQHFLKNKYEVVKNYEVEKEKWVYDIETENGEFQLGIGNIVVSNSERRGFNFVTRKISYGVAQIKAGVKKELVLGDTKIKRDWGYAPDYVECMWKMLQQDKPDDYVIGMGEMHTVQEFVEEAFKVAKLNWKDYLKQDPKLFRPGEVYELCADASKAKKVLGWKPKIKFKELVKIMVLNDLKEVKK